MWCDHADDVRGLGIGSGHLMPEEHPDRVYAALKEFFSVWLSFRLWNLAMRNYQPIKGRPVVEKAGEA